MKVVQAPTDMLSDSTVRILPRGSYSGREIDWTKNQRQLTNNSYSHQCASGKHNQNSQAFYDRTIQQKFGLGIRPINTPTNYQGIKSIPYRNKTVVPFIAGEVNTSSLKIPQKSILSAIPAYPRQFLP